MSEKEKKMAKRFEEIIQTLPDGKKERILGIAEGMALMKDREPESKEKEKA